MNPPPRKADPVPLSQPPSARAFRDAAGLFATGVALVTARHDGALYGITVNSFSSVSLDPPLVSVNLDRRLRGLDALLATPRFGIVFLAEEQAALSTAFATVGADKWAHGAHRITEAGCPVVEPHSGAMECEHHARYDGGDHLILLGRVINIIPPIAERPLLFWRGRYGSIGAHDPNPDRTASEAPAP